MLQVARRLLPVSLCAAAATGAYAWHTGTSKRRTHVPVRCAEVSVGRDFLSEKAGGPREENTRHSPYVIIGAGTTAHAAIETILQTDSSAQVLLIVDREDLPQPPNDLQTRESLPKPSAAVTRIFNEWRRHICGRLEVDDTTGPVKILVSNDLQSIDVDKRRIVFKDQSYITYEKCLLAQTGKPQAFYVLDSSKISYKFRDKINTCMYEEDFYQLDRIPSSDDIRTITVLGGGFLGTEVASLLATACNGKKEIQHVYAEEAPLVRHLPSYLSEHLKLILTLRGVRPVSLRVVTRISANPDFKSIDDKDSGKARTLTLQTVGANTADVKSDYIILASTKIDPQNSLAQVSGLEVDPNNGGVCTNAHFEAANGLFVAGVGASYFDRYLGRRRVVSYDHAINSGMLVGRNMVAARWAGLGAEYADEMHSYHHQPVFRSSLPGAGVQMVGIGEIDTRMATVGVWLRPPVSTAVDNAPPGSVERLSKDYNVQSTYDYQRGIVYYLHEGKIRGILLWNAEDLLEQARRALITQAASGTSFRISGPPPSRPFAPHAEKAEEVGGVTTMEEDLLDPTSQFLQNLIKIGPSEWSHVMVEQPRKRMPSRSQTRKTSL